MICCFEKKGSINNLRFGFVEIVVLIVFLFAGKDRVVDDLNLQAFLAQDECCESLRYLFFHDDWRNGSCSENASDLLATAGCDW